MFELLALLILSQQPREPYATGTASYYTVASSSGITASGEPMRDDKFTCALPEGEFGDYFLVVAENGNSVTCRLNDRGPFVAGRVIDLSRAAMRALDSESDLLEVTIYHLGPNPSKVPPGQLAAR